MAITKLPETYEYKCDLCGYAGVFNGGNDYKRVPDGWASIIVNYQETDVDRYKRSGREEMLLCPEHSTKLAKFLDGEKR